MSVYEQLFISSIPISLPSTPPSIPVVHFVSSII